MCVRHGLHARSVMATVNLFWVFCGFPEDCVRFGRMDTEPYVFLFFLIAGWIDFFRLVLCVKLFSLIFRPFVGDGWRRRCHVDFRALRVTPTRAHRSPCVSLEGFKCTC